MQANGTPPRPDANRSARHDHPVTSGNAGPVLPAKLAARLTQLIQSIYPDHDATDLSTRMAAAFWPDGRTPRKRGRLAGNALWSERDSFVITYGNSFTDGEHKPLDLLRDFAESHLAGTFTGIHILPYFPFTSDDGFAITDYTVVNSQLGSWEDINRIAGDFKFMSDLVLNHCSMQHKWFSEYLQGHEPYDRFSAKPTPKTI